MTPLSRRTLIGATGAAALATAPAAAARPDRAADPQRHPGRGHGRPGRPNVVLLVADDMGWSDITPFGSVEIRTPHLQELAERGTRMTNAHVSPYCAPTRSMLLTGQDNHEVGLGNMIELVAPEQEGQPGYEGHLNERAVTVARRLQETGYRTFLSGKWHLGIEQSGDPTRWGFDRAFSMLRGESNHYQYVGPNPSPDGPDLFTLDGGVYEVDEAFYSTTQFTDTFLEFLDETPQTQPFFGVLSFTAPHSPLQAPEEDVARYRGMFDAGPQALADARLARLKELGLVDEDVVPHPIVGAEDWATMTPEERAPWTRRMEVYAAMVDTMDQAIGRVMDALRERGQLEDTIVVFLSDNGAAGSLREGNRKWGPWIRENFDNSLENMGRGTSYISTGPVWAQASMSPFALFKGFTTDGGTISPTIIAGPGVARGAVSGAYLDVRDIVPTLLRLTGTPERHYAGAAPIRGRDFSRELRRPDADREGPRQAQCLEINGSRSVRLGRWKALSVSERTGGYLGGSRPSGRWLLFDLEADPGETTDLAAEQPRVLRRLKREYERYAAEVGVVPVGQVSG
ncbi:arylsulfatase [Micrococcus sp.]|uniref:arylsulfatase n=1 Tax=Micrococcus sp. TaxID=1271 RepID=UPI0026DBC09A|nr:arylsulfatase [Micrococcus sp.]MDO4238766.1 arylsulfatase [Micrococcus sp.]